MSRPKNANGIRITTRSRDGIQNDNKIISIQQIIDTRRNIEKLLVSLVIEKKI
jgi:hypothetical protein